VLPGLARDEPAVALRLLAALLPLHAEVVDGPLAYDLAVPGFGVLAVELGHGVAAVARRSRPRRRRAVAFRARLDVPALADLLAGAAPPPPAPRGLLFRARRAEQAAAALGALPRVDLALAHLAERGIALEPALAFHPLARAVEPAWTRGHAFAVGHDVPGAGSCVVAVEDGAGLRVLAERPAHVDATVTASPATFLAVLGGAPAPRGDKPAIRGDLHAVAQLKAWTDRAQGLAPAPGAVRPGA
jgi:hypothetical protein